MGEATLKLGRRPPKNAPALRLASLLTGVVPAHPDAVDYLATLTDWQMLGNDQYGDCVAVTWANQRRLVTAALAGNETYPGLDQVLAFYKTQNPDFPTQDDGMDIQTALEALVHDGGPDGVKAVAFAKVNYRNLDEVKAALAIFGDIWLGINVQNANMDDFDQGKPWDYHEGASVDGGHSVEVGGYSTPTPTDDVRFITWAKETGFTDNFWTHLVEEAWVVIWPEHLGSKAFLEGVDLGTLAIDYKTLTGRDLPLPEPAPSPTPSGCLDDADKTLFAAVGPWLAAKHLGSNRTAQTAVKVWAKSKGLL